MALPPAGESLCSGAMVRKLRSTPDFSREQNARATGATRIAGIDEAGRGPWAGPVVAAAVVFTGHVPDGIDDSKRLSPERREVLFSEISAIADVGIGIADVARIDRDNILNATLWAMAQAADTLASGLDHALVDGNRPPSLPCPCDTIIGGDGISVSIAAASIIAKVTRDRIMTALEVDFPGYGFVRNKGYGTAEHQAGLARIGVTIHHRRSFAPIRLLLAEGESNRGALTL